MIILMLDFEDNVPPPPPPKKVKYSEVVRYLHFYVQNCQILEKLSLLTGTWYRYTVLYCGKS
jgi:hypothetical protein